MRFPHTGKMIDLGEALEDLTDDLSDWSQATFGSDDERGPIGALKHLEKEAREALEAEGEDRSLEICDCFILILDAARRHGMSPMNLLKESQRKMMINRKRTWPTPVGDEPSFHWPSGQD